MRLSHAILLGQPLIDEPRSCDLARCAFGMARAAIGQAVAMSCAAEYQRTKDIWGWTGVSRERVEFPCGCGTYSNVNYFQAIAHLFDSHVMEHPVWPRKGERWTLEQLADYVRSIEPAEPSEAVCGEGPNEVTERAELLKVKAEELETMPR